MGSRGERNRGGIIVLTISAIAVVLLVYVLVYPLALRWALDHGYQHEFKLVYWPLRWILYRVQPLGELMMWYSSLFDD